MNIRLILIALISVLGLSQCKTQYKLQKNPSFTVIKAFYQDWVGGQPGNSGTVVQIFTQDIINVKPDSLYFQNRVAVIDVKPAKTDGLWVANFRKEFRKEVVINDNPDKTVVTEVPETSNFPFELAKDEAVLRYMVDDKVYYYKITGIVKKETIFYPAARPNR